MIHFLYRLTGLDVFIHLSPQIGHATIRRGVTKATHLIRQTDWFQRHLILVDLSIFFTFRHESSYKFTCTDISALPRMNWSAQTLPHQ